MKQIQRLSFLLVLLIPCSSYSQSSFKCRLDSIWVTSTHMYERYAFTYDEQGRCLSEDYKYYREDRDHVTLNSKQIIFEYDSLGRNIKTDFMRLIDNGAIDREVLVRLYDNQGGWTQHEYHYSEYQHDFWLSRVTYPEYGDKKMTLYTIALGVNPANVFKEEYLYADSLMNIPVMMREYYLRKDSNIWVFRYERNYQHEKELEQNSENKKYDSLGNGISKQDSNGAAQYEYDTSTERHQVMGLHYEPNDMLDGYFTHPHLLKLSEGLKSKIIESKRHVENDKYYDWDEYTTYFYTQLE